VFHTLKIAFIALCMNACIFGGGWVYADYKSATPLIFPIPAELFQKGGHINLKKINKIWHDDASEGNARLLKDELKVIGLQMETAAIETAQSINGGIVLEQRSNRMPTFSTERPFSLNGVYQLSVSERGIYIIGADLQGQFYGILAFLQLIDISYVSVPQIDITDRPQMQFRGLRGHFPKDNSYEIEQFKRIIRAMSLCRLNQLWIRDLYVRRFPASIKLESHPEISDDDAISKRLAGELIQYARQQNVLVMGSVSSTADIVWSIYPGLIEMKPNETPGAVTIKNESSRTSKYRYGARFNFCPSTEGTYRLLFDLIDELAPLFTSEFFDLGIDEVSQYQNGSRWVADDLCRGKDPARLFAEYTNRLAGYVIDKGKIPVVNSTPFIKEHGGAFHDLYNSVGLIRKDILINNWSEGFVRKKRRQSLFGSLFKNTDFKSTEYFANHGLYNIIHMVQAGNRWKDRPELLEKKGKLNCLGAFITHYTYLTGKKLNPKIIDAMAFSGNHFWTPDRPEMLTEDDEIITQYGGYVVKNLLKGESYMNAIIDARSRLSKTHH
jgi:hypothetical protein